MGCARLASTNSPIRAGNTLLVHVGNALERAWRLGPAVAERVTVPAAVGGGWASQIANYVFSGCRTDS